MSLISLLIAPLLAATLPAVDENVVEKAIRPHQGQIVVVNLWATWCGPCREEFPDLVRLYNENKGSVVLVAVSMDEPEDAAKAREYLETHKSDFPAYIRGFKDFDAFSSALDPDWKGAIPATFIFDQSGKRVFSHEGKVTYKQLKKVISRLK
ncbi:MAG TPA: TlpA disulfide reductase family protein [Acidobacteriota bacterium]|jgi:thiol-disulfide isomerase/thioredoxin|nr:TlpA disulfide reductase family protein [Acidobacteriota bacterium]